MCCPYSLFWYCFFPFLYQQSAVAAWFEGHLYKYRVRALEREHAVLGKVFWQVDEVLAVFSSEKSSSSIINHLLTPRFNFWYKSKGNA